MSGCRAGSSLTARFLLVFPLVLMATLVPGWSKAETAASAEGSDESPSSAATGRPDEASEVAKENYRIGVAAFREGRFREAITAFLVADRLSPSAALSFNIARANDELAKPDEALYWYGDYLRRAPEATDRADVLATMADRERQLAQAGVQLLVVLSRPSDATLFVDGARVGRTPWHGTLSPGEYDLRVDLAEHESWTSRLTLTQSKSIELPVELSESATPLPLAPESVDEPVDPVPQRGPTQTPIGGERSATGWDAGVWPWVALGAGAVSFGVAGGFELARRSAENEAETSTVQVDKQEALDRMDRDRKLGRVMLGVGAAFAVAGGVLWLLDEGGADSDTAIWTPMLGPDDVALRLSGRF